MDSDYDRKFEEMKKYIPFLESMIKRLESTNNGVQNPRKAQLDKIRSLRDLLLDKKKRMKMENLLKCEQVLVNLYAKVEQRDSMAEVKEDSAVQTQKEKSDLNTVRNKLKSVVSKLHDDAPETLPEIARATNTEVVCTPGSKEPALFQRRPNKVSPLRQTSNSQNDDNSSSSKRYTRVLMSPESKKKEWLTNSDTNTDTPLFSRRSPRRSPRRYSPSYKRERKKSSKQRSKSSQHSKDFNITLKVPQESLGSLNTKDILSRIINCSDSDVDIDTLRGLRSQILGELKQTGNKDDISDLILKSYKKKEKRSKKRDDVEEGELSDSESEAIENIYGSLVVVNQGEGNSNLSKSNKKQPRNIQICLVINSDKETVSKVNDQVISTNVDITDFETYTDNKTPDKAPSSKTEDKIINESPKKEIEVNEKKISLEEIKSPRKAIEDISKSSNAPDTSEIDKTPNSPRGKPQACATEAFKPNFYQPTRPTEENTNLEESTVKLSPCKSSAEDVVEEKNVNISNPVEVNKKTLDSSIKTRMKKEIVSEIDILQALKKEILGETTTVPLPEVVTPPLHQPKIMKVTSAQETISKKRISIEKYKQKSVPSAKQPLYNSVKQQSSSKDDNTKKQSLKLTEKECERFNFPVNVSPVDSSEDEDKQRWDFDLHQGTNKSTSLKLSDNSAPDFEFRHGDSVPKSPDHEDFADTGIRPPVIIPSDPVKNIVPSAKADIDMRMELPTALKVSLDGIKKSTSSSSVTSEKVFEATWNEKSLNDVDVRKSNLEHRLRMESDQSTAKNSPNSSTNESERVPRPNMSYTNIPPLMSLNVPTLIAQPQNPNVNINPTMTPIRSSKIPLLKTPNMPPNMTPTMTPGLVPNINPSMTPSRMIPGMNPMMTPILTPNSRSYEMTPRPNFDIDDYPNPKHVYAPMFPVFEPHDFSEKEPHHVNEITREDRNRRSTSVQRDFDYHRNRNDRSDCPSTPNPSFGRMDCPSTPNPSFGRMECPSTPNPSFGRMDCPSTPNPSFGRMECPPTPNPSFGRMDCPLTPNPSFGRMETPMTPVHSFGRSDCPMTPSHPFGRSDTNVTQSNVYGRGDYHRNSSSFNHNYNMKSQDPRLNRSSDYDKCQNRNDERNRSYFEDDRSIAENANRYRRSQANSYEQDSRNSRDGMSRRESSVGRSLSRDYERNEPYKKDYYNNDYHSRRDKCKYADDVSNRRNYRARSIGRTNTSEEKNLSDRERRGVNTYTREDSIEKPISVQSHTGRSFNIDTSFNRTFQETKSPSLDKSFDVRRQRASSVGRSLRESPTKDLKQPTNNKSKFLLDDVPDRRSMQFRRASSVGRELKDYHSNKNFKDVKEDLRSCKFNNYNFGVQNKDHKSKPHCFSNEKVASNEYQRNRDTRPISSSGVKSSGHQTYSDPRRRPRQPDLNNSKIEDISKYSPRKNFRDPRMRRELDSKNTSKDKYKDKDRYSSSSRYKNYGIVYSNDNIAKGTILASAAGVKNFKIPKIKRVIEEKEVETSNQVEIDANNETSLKIVKKDTSTDQNKSAETETKRSDNNATNERQHNIENLNKNIAVKLGNSKSREDTNLLSKSSDDSCQDETSNSVNSVSDGCGRRVTRSSIKSGTPSKQISSISPVKKLKRIKKPIIYDSDSDSQENISTDDNVKEIDKNKNVKSAEIPKLDLHVDKDKTAEKSNMKQDDALDRMEIRKDKEGGDFFLSDNNKEKCVPATTNESCEVQNDSLDISFGVDDDLFSDNIASGSVLDNINALIADLDHDIEAPKINDFNDKFINNIVGNISSNDSPIPLGGNQIDFASDVTLNNKFGFVVDVQNSNKLNSGQIVLEHKIATKINENNSNPQSEQMLSIQNDSKDAKSNETKGSEQIVITQRKDETDTREKYDKSTSEIQEVINYINAEAVVSTTELEEKSDASVKDSRCLVNKTLETTYPFVPDSTNNSSKNNVDVKDKDEQESVPDSTNELASEMNITSSPNSIDTKEQSHANSTSTDNLPRIDSIGKLLSILEDKNKIKELLTMLSKDSGENEKIKKKLEKLSEIVSEEEENTVEEVSKDIQIQENQTLAVGSSEKTKDVVALQIENDDKESDVDSNKISKVSHGESLLPSGTNSSDEVTANEELKEIDTKLESTVNEQENVIINKKSVHPDDQNKSDNCDEKEDKDEKINKDSEKTQKTEKVGDVMNIVNCDEKISNEKVKDIKNSVPIPLKTGKKFTKKNKITKRGRSRLAKKLAENKDKRVTRSDSGFVPQIPPIPKKPSRELKKLQEDIREMFISEDILNATGIRMCRLAKLVDDKNSKSESATTEVEPEPIVVLENIKSKIVSDESHDLIEKNKKKLLKCQTPQNEPSDSESKGKTMYKPGPKSKTKKQEDPYIFETESVAESNKTGDSIDQNMESDSDSVSTKSFGSSELLVEIKKKKRKRRRWQLGVIKKKSVKNKSVGKNVEFSIPATQEVVAHEIKETITYVIPDFNCFTDKSYCFHKNVKIYVCRLCGYRGNDIVPHYKKNHPHSEIPLSRLSPEIAKEAIEQCENMNLQAICKIQTTRYVCRFCFQEFHKHNTALESFFWHVVSVHTGEYKHICPECINVTRCPFHLDIPPPPKNLKGQLIGYICGRCNFTQVSLENLKTHVIVRHDDEQTEVYSINLGEIPRKLLQSLVSKVSDPLNEGLRVLRSTRSNPSVTEPSDDCSDVTENTDRMVDVADGQDNLVQEIIPVPPKLAPKNKFQSKFVFENDDNSDASSYSRNEEIINASIKRERDDDTQDSYQNDTIEEAEDALELTKEPVPEEQTPLGNSVDKNTDVQTELTPCNDVLDYPHFKIKLSGTGIKEYICCINGTENHYKTTLLISFKKHVQLKHSENWDGYCFVCKLIVTGQGKHTFKDCLQHFLDKHMDNFPIFEEVSKPMAGDIPETETSVTTNDAPTSKTYINVRPLSELISTESESQVVHSPLPKIQSVVSLGTSDDSINSELQKDDKVYNYEQAQAEVMTKKHLVVLQTMLSPEKLVHVFKCAGRFCSYTTDNAEEALLHASTHQRIGGECSLKCTYCDFDCSGNAIDLVMHVFKNYKHCSYSCSKCFYRAAASQLVYAHIKRVHTEFDADKVPVLSSTTIVKDNSPDNLMSRDEAVLHYICNNRDPDEGGICQFKSYVLTKFREHLQTRHGNDENYSCFMCNTSTPSSKLLAQHLKSHGLRIYQCCRCLFGADNETELLAHASEKHPIKQPKAYLRIITSKGGSSEVRVLPLAVLSKSSVESTVVSPSNDKESPVKQAERSIDLQKLINQTNLMIQSMHTTTNAATIEPVNVTASESQIQVETENRSRPNSRAETERSSPAVLTLLSEPQDTPLTPSVFVKMEPFENEPKTSEVPPDESTSAPSDDVVCLDSDDDTRQNIIDLSGDDIPELNTSKKQDETDVKLSRTCLYKCSKCSLLSKSEGMFKRHIISCIPNPNEIIKCAYCSYTVAANRIVNHYNSVHLENILPYSCAKCNEKFVSLSVAKKHMKHVHNETSTNVYSKVSSTGIAHFIIDSHVKERQAPKRKLSSEVGNKNPEPAPKMKKYGPLDVDKLPINPILDDLVYCSLCEFNTKVRLNMVRHLQLHAEQQPVPRTAPVNPVPHLETHEKHFDKMLNLASSSITTSSKPTSAAEPLSPEAAAIYPKYVPDKHRYTCGAKGCSYISVNESMFKIHWETLHAGTNDYHCVHCPPHQHLDTSKPLTAVRIIAHLKMHDMKLYACSSCTFYHNTRKLVEKHLREVHTGRLIVVREEGAPAPPPPPAPVQSSTAPTMDLKPWQCGLCKFKSMIRPEVIEHCGKFHQSKMQFKCTYCGFRTSNIENISKHQSKQHPGKKEEVFYFYYREGSIPEDSDGVARWQKQSQKNVSEIKTESEIPPVESVPVLPKPPPAKPALNLDIVKKEVDEPEMSAQVGEGIDDLCKSFGQFCDPNGLKYKCPLCKVIIEDTKEAMQSHLYEELQYRKWGCAVCSYKAFHKPGLQQHVQTEHLHSREAKEPIELQVQPRIETWVAKLLEHQTTIIEKNKENLAKQKAEILRANPSTPKVVEKPVETQASAVPKPNVSMAELEKLFGPLGVPSNMNYTCPKCNISARSEAVMQEHLESELNKIRWCCNVCSDTFQTYHEAQFHCRSVHQGQSARPVEAPRDTGLRAAWVSGVLHVQKLSMHYMPVTEPACVPPPPVPPTPASTDNAPENSLLVVRYEEKVPTPEEQMKLNKKNDTDDDKSAPDDPEKKKAVDFQCQYCPAMYKYESFFHVHVLKHYGLKPFSCPYCMHTNYKKQMESHILAVHPNRPVVRLNTPIPPTAPVHDYLKPATVSKPTIADVENMIICLGCEEAMSRDESLTHYHDAVRPQFGVKGSVVYRCGSCLTLHKSVIDFNMHHRRFHPNEKKNSSFYKLQGDTKCLYCSVCNQNFGTTAQYRSHQQTKHGLKSFTPSEASASDVIDLDDDVGAGKRKSEDTSILPVPKRVARKSTTKLPSMAVARKSTTKLPLDVPCYEEEYSFYGSKPSMDNLENVTTLMPFCNTFVPFTLKKLNDIIKIYPVVVVKDINYKQ